VVSGAWRGVEFEFDERGCVGEATRVDGSRWVGGSR
jgi:hypothetical protein